MRRSILWPPSLSGGRLVMTPDPAVDTTDPDVEIRQTIALSLLDCGNANPFNGALGVPEQAYRSAGAADAARLNAAVRARFAQLERDHRARLVEIVIGDVVDGPLTARPVTVVYENLETGERQQMEASLNG